MHAGDEPGNVVHVMRQAYGEIGALGPERLALARPQSRLIQTRPVKRMIAVQPAECGQRSSVTVLAGAIEQIGFALTSQHRFVVEYACHDRIPRSAMAALMNMLLDLVTW